MGLPVSRAALLEQIGVLLAEIARLKKLVVRCKRGHEMTPENTRTIKRMRSGRPGIQNKCRACDREYARERYKRDPKRPQKYSRAYYWRNVEKCAERAKLKRRMANDRKRRQDSATTC